MSFCDWAIVVASMAWDWNGPVNRYGVLQVIKDCFMRMLTNINDLVGFLLCWEQVTATLSSGKLCCRSKKRWYVEEYLVSLLKDRDKSNMLFYASFIAALQKNRSCRPVSRK